MEVIGDLLPPGVLNVVNGFGAELGQELVGNSKVAKAAFTGSAATQGVWLCNTLQTTLFRLL